MGWKPSKEPTKVVDYDMIHGAMIVIAGCLNASFIVMNIDESITPAPAYWIVAGLLWLASLLLLGVVAHEFACPSKEKP